jgi:hypothetical protein
MWCDVWLCVFICETFCTRKSLIQGLSRWYRDSDFLWKSGVLQCAYFYIWDFSLVGIMQQFSTQSKLNLAHMTWEHIFQAIYISFSYSYLVHEMSLWQKGTYAPPQDKAWGLNIHVGKWGFGPIWSKYAIQPQIKHNQATKTGQDHVKAFTHKRAYTWHFSKT